MLVNGFTARELQVAIKLIKDYFEKDLSDALNLTRVSAPLFVKTDTGLNDNLSGNEKAVEFSMRKYNEKLEIVQSLAKWKRMALKRYGFKTYEGLYTDMNAIRPDEYVDKTHSIYVDQWDWEKIIKYEDRNLDYLFETVRLIYKVFKDTEIYINEIFPNNTKIILPEEIFFIDSQTLEDLYPNYSPKDRENMIAKEKKAVFIYKIGDKLKSGKPHDLRSPDYDDWNLNGDIIFYSPAINEAIELSSMGIRVDSSSLKRQLNITDCTYREKYEYHQLILKDELPFTIGGGIGQSRICMFFLQTKHIGQVQASVWPENELKKCKDENIFLL